jgi:polysaccharide deacetylase family protein (PEP-CTERM system associated)
VSPSAYTELVEIALNVGPATLVSVDVEDYFHEVPGGERAFQSRGLPSNLARNLERLLDLFAETGTTATFFVLSCAAHRIGPQLQRMAAEGHEIASHGHGHLRATWLEPHEFREDLRRGKATIEDITGQPVAGFRAPFFAITERNLWALDEIRAAGFAYDSSVCPVRNFAYGIPDAPERPHLLRNGLLEIPMSQVKVLGYRLMVSGGFYLRLYPFWLTRLLFRLRDRHLPRVLYIHPWEWDDPSLNVWDLGVDDPAVEWRPRLMKWITTHNRHLALERFARLLEAGPPGRPLGRVLGPGRVAAREPARV